MIQLARMIGGASLFTISRVPAVMVSSKAPSPTAHRMLESSPKSMAILWNVKLRARNNRISR